MKKTAENRYPHSATLFRFCKEALEIRYDGNVKVIDQDVGAILGYDPADCSHWKKGKKNIRSLTTLKNIAEHLNIDERLLIDIAAGKVSLEEAVFEYKGYGDFMLKGNQLEILKKEFFKNPNKWHRGESVKSFEEVFNIDRNGVIDVVNEILLAGKFNEAPIYLPEVFQLFPQIKLVSNSELVEGVIVCENDEEGIKSGQKVLTYRGPQMRPFVRFLLAKELFKYLIEFKHPFASRFHQTPQEIIDIQSNIFAGALLVPSRLLQVEVDKIDTSVDLIQQLADVFWVSKSLMNQRLSDFMDNWS